MQIYIYNSTSTGYPIPDGYPVDTGTGPFFYPIGLVGMDICIRIGYDIGSGIIIPEHNPTRCHPYTCVYFDVQIMIFVSGYVYKWQYFILMTNEV
jgi:hypothetical protein